DCYDEDGELFDQKLGVILDISLGGMLIETDDTIKAYSAWQNHTTHAELNHTTSNTKRLSC
ncbi:MAG: hypothetical protein WCB15_33750, partial [Desulfobacterales bacterium]